MSLCPQYLNFFLQVILRCITTVAHQQVGGGSSVFIVKIPDRSKCGQLTVYLETAWLYGTAYAASRGSEKYSSDFGWLARIAKQEKIKEKNIYSASVSYHKKAREGVV